jgi:hypothetical protein
LTPCRAAGGRKAGRKLAMGAGRNQQGVSLPPFFAAHTTQAKGGRFAALLPVAAKQLSLRPWRLVALPSSLFLSRRTPA